MPQSATDSSPKLDYYPAKIVQKHAVRTRVDSRDAKQVTQSHDIGWVPDPIKHLERRHRLLRDVDLEKSLPIGVPASVDGKFVWKGRDLEADDYVLRLSKGHLEEIDRAVAKINQQGIPFDSISRATFTLPSLGPILERRSIQVHGDGCGFCIVSGVPTANYSREDHLILYLGISSYFGEQRGRQALDGRIVTHITDLHAQNATDQHLRPIYSNLAQPFHADVICHILAMYFTGVADIGGENGLASSWLIYNELAKMRPYVIHTLMKDDWPHDTYGYNPAYYRRALLHFQDGKPILNYSRRILTGTSAAPRSSSVPALTDRQADALDEVEFLARKYAIRFKAQAGDMLFINNFGVLHSRDAFQDCDGSAVSPARKRYMMRLWLNSTQLGWGIPPGLQLPWDRLFDPLDEIPDVYDADPFGNFMITESSSSYLGDGASIDQAGSSAAAAKKATEKKKKEAEEKKKKEEEEEEEEEERKRKEQEEEEEEEKRKEEEAKSRKRGKGMGSGGMGLSSDCG